LLALLSDLSGVFDNYYTLYQICVDTIPASTKCQKVSLGISETLKWNVYASYASAVVNVL